MIEQRFLTTAGVAINLAAGPRSGPPIVLLHGVTRRWQDWLTVLPHLAQRWQVFSFDLRGHGLSARTPGRYRIADYVPDVVDFLRKALEEPALVIGHSLGGNVAAAVAAEAPEQVRGLVLEDPPLEMASPRLAETPFVEMFRVFIRHAGSDAPVEQIAAEMAEARVPAVGRSEWVRFGDVRDAISLRSSAAGLKRLDPEVLEVPIAGRWLDGSDVRDTLGRIQCPTLLLQAEQTMGGLLTDSYAAEMAALLRNGVRQKLAGVGHNIHGIAPEAMMRLVVPFLSSLE